MEEGVEIETESVMCLDPDPEERQEKVFEHPASPSWDPQDPNLERPAVLKVSLAPLKLPHRILESVATSPQAVEVYPRTHPLVHGELPCRRFN